MCRRTREESLGAFAALHCRTAYGRCLRTNRVGTFYCNAPRRVCANTQPRDRVFLIREFVVFLKKFGVLALAVGVLLGEQVNNLEKALIDDVVMPLLDPLLPSGS